VSAKRKGSALALSGAHQANLIGIVAVVSVVIAVVEVHIPRVV
jgi:hypothetical protein